MDKEDARIWAGPRRKHECGGDHSVDGAGVGDFLQRDASISRALGTELQAQWRGLVVGIQRKRLGESSWVAFARAARSTLCARARQARSAVGLGAGVVAVALVAIEAPQPARLASKAISSASRPRCLPRGRHTEDENRQAPVCLVEWAEQASLPPEPIFDCVRSAAVSVVTSGTAPFFCRLTGPPWPREPVDAATFLRAPRRSRAGGSRRCEVDLQQDVVAHRDLDHRGCLRGLHPEVLKTDAGAC